MDSPFSVGQWLWLIPGEPIEACRGLEQGRLEILHCPKIGVMESRSYHCIFKVEAMIILSLHIPSICSCFDQGFCSEGRPSAPGMGLVLFGSDRCCPALFWMCCDLWCGILVCASRSPCQQFNSALTSMVSCLRDWFVLCDQTIAEEHYEGEDIKEQDDGEESDNEYTHAYIHI